MSWFLLLTAASAGTGAASSGSPARPAQRSPVVVQVGDNGFHWGDAAIGAAATLGLGVAAAGVLVVAHSASPRSERNGHA